MELYLLRHAIAVARGTPGYENDSERPLTPDGARKMRRIAQGMRELDLSFGLILSSPYLRARQTAEVVVQVFKAQDEFKLSATLTPDGDPAALIGEFNANHHSPGSILLVGHEPYMSELVSTLVTGDPSYSLNITLKKGGLCKLTTDTLQYGRCATLEWLLTPRQLILMR
jgi:phosphohistidine phosphatase